MIDIWQVASNSLWILGLAVVLATLSWAYWAAQTAGERLRAVLGRPRVQRFVNLGLCLFCAGLAATAHAWWERGLWALLSAAWLVQACLIARKGKGREQGGDTR